MMDDCNLVRFTVGECRDEWKTGGDGCILEYMNECGLCLYVMLAGVDTILRRQFDTDRPLMVRVTEFSDLVFFCFRFGEAEWMDCPLSMTIYQSAGRPIEFPALGNKEGLALNVLLIDSNTGELLTARVVGLGHDFSVRFLEWAKKNCKTSMDFNEYKRQVEELYKLYQTVDFVNNFDYGYDLQSAD